MDQSVERPYHWATPKSDGFSIWLQGEHLTATNKVLQLTEVQHEELNKLIRSGRPDIAQNVQYIDMKAAEEVAKAHIASHRGVASAGAHSTNSALGGSNANLQDAPKVDIPDPGQGKPALNAFQARLQAQQAGKIQQHPEETNKGPASEVTKRLEVIEEGVFHPEDMTPEQIETLQHKPVQS